MRRCILTAVLAVMLTRWQRLGRAPEVLRPANLGPQDLAGLIAEMLRLAPVEALRLAGALSRFWQECPASIWRCHSPSAADSREIGC